MTMTKKTEHGLRIAATASVHLATRLTTGRVLRIVEPD
jgi:hypothetical protein